MALLKERDGLMLGICNGFQALINWVWCSLWRNTSKSRELSDAYI